MINSLDVSDLCHHTTKVDVTVAISGWKALSPAVNQMILNQILIAVGCDADAGRRSNHRSANYAPGSDELRARLAADIAAMSEERDEYDRDDPTGCH